MPMGIGGGAPYSYLNQYGFPAGSIYSTPNRGPGMMAQAKRNKAAQADLFDENGLPTRPPQNQQEAIYFQWMAARAAQKMQERRVNSALSALKYGMGLSLQSSPYSLSAMQAPYLRDISQANLGVQYQQPDYSYFLRPDAYGRQQAGPMGGGGYREGNWRSPLQDNPMATQPGNQPWPQDQMNPNLWWNYDTRELVPPADTGM